MNVEHRGKTQANLHRDVESRRVFGTFYLYSYERNVATCCFFFFPPNFNEQKQDCAFLKKNIFSHKTPSKR